jgi:hypothetical protein
MGPPLRLGFKEAVQFHSTFCDFASTKKNRLKIIEVHDA